MARIMRRIASSSLVRRQIEDLPLFGLHAFREFCTPGTPYKPTDITEVDIVRKRGIDLLHDPLWNKGTAFSVSERERLELRGLLPKKLLSMETQVQRLMEDYEYGRDYISADHITDGGVTRDHVRRWKVLQELQDRNETLFYRILLDNFPEMAPIVYTPTVGWACLNYHKLYRRPRGMYFDATDKGEMAAMVWNWPANEVDAIVITDGSRILGLGDLGLNGLGISIGKLDLYVAAAGFHPSKVLPVVLDVGTQNMGLRDDPLYIGLDQDRLNGDEYYEIVDELVRALTSRYPNAVLQFEDFNMAHALPLLERYREHHLCFNDDVQGTAATAVAGVYGALAVQGKDFSELTKQRIVLIGAGSAGMGVARMLALGMLKQGISYEEALGNFWVLDADGLITIKRPTALNHTVKSFARKTQEDVEGETLVETVRRVKPTVLVGLAGAGKLFTEEVLTLMGQNNERPIIMPMSNPTHKMECNAEEAQKATGGRAIFASGSPCADVQYEGRTIKSSQANNMVVFPGLALGAHLGATGTITDKMLMAAAEALPSCILPEDLELDIVYPRLCDIRDVSLKVAMAVIKQAHEEGHVGSDKALKALETSDEELAAFIKEHMYEPVYKPLVSLPVGVLE
ncbi:hypothetical protein WJX75_009960 [Coccomyxa subellipsoidea]|uniref:Malic enzyme n=1 Tax=Coccomyxa subellipsoidea TaxID=248742 RepID=A0ABR2YFM3_9CHLO